MEGIEKVTQFLRKHRLIIWLPWRETSRESGLLERHIFLRGNYISRQEK